MAAVTQLTSTEYEDGLEHRKVQLGDNESTQAMLVDIEARLSEAMYRLNSESETVGAILMAVKHADRRGAAAAPMGCTVGHAAAHPRPERPPT